MPHIESRPEFTMLEYSFIARTSQPTGADRSAALGTARATWDRILVAVAREHAVERARECHSPGWSLRVARKERTNVWLWPVVDGFRVRFNLGAKAVRAAHEARLSAAIVTAFDAAPKYPEGPGQRLEVRSPASLGALQTLTAIKVAN